MALETVERKGVPIMAAGGPYHGVGSPPEGDYYTVDQLEQFARDTNELITQIDPPAKIGHSFGQRLLKDSLLSDDEKPAVGYLRNLRVEGGKLLADLIDVPKKFNQLIDAGAFRKRSAETAVLRRQGTGKDGRRYHVIKGLAWLGAKAPAMRNLDEVAALYSDDEEAERFLAAEGDEPTWNPNQGYRWIQERIHSALNTGASSETRFYVADVGPADALVLHGNDGHIVPFDVESGRVTVAPSSQWSVAQSPWVKLALDYRDFVETEPVGVKRTPPDTRGVEELTLTEEQIAKFAEVLGVEVAPEADDITAEQLLAKADELKAKAEEKREVELVAREGVRQMSEDEFTELKTKAESGDKAATELWEMKRKSFLDAAEETGRIVPAQREIYERLYEQDEEAAREIIAGFPVNDNLLREYGSDETNLGEEGQYEEALYRRYQAYQGRPVPEESK